VRVLLSDGSGLTARQTATRLARAGHVVEALAPSRLCLTGMTRHVRRVHCVPAYGDDPFSWLDAALGVYRRGGFDVLFPTQEQVAVLAASPERLREAGVATAVPSFEALSRVQDKVSAFETLRDFGLPQPQAAVAGSAVELAGWERLPAFVKLPIGTATSGVRRVAGGAELAALAIEHEESGAFERGGVLVQAEAAGELAMIQSVFARGEPVAFHANLRVREGASGGASHKRSIELPAAREHLAALGAGLGWHGALSADAILTPEGPHYIDLNPRLVEPGNAIRAGVDLVAPMLELALGSQPSPQPAGRAGVSTHQLLLAVLGAAERGRGRRGVLRELIDAWRHRGAYRDSAEELTPLRGDPLTALPVAAAALATLARPETWSWFSSGSVSAYALSPAGWEEIRARHEAAQNP
jgi:hypothetical protein